MLRRFFDSLRSLRMTKREGQDPPLQFLLQLQFFDGLLHSVQLPLIFDDQRFVRISGAKPLESLPGLLASSLPKHPFHKFPVQLLLAAIRHIRAGGIFIFPIPSGHTAEAGKPAKQK